MPILLILISLPAALLALLNAYQATTGRRLSTKPRPANGRSDAQAVHDRGHCARRARAPHLGADGAERCHMTESRQSKTAAILV